jgi:cytochrome c553
MSPFASVLSDQDIDDISLYLESIKEDDTFYEELEWDIDGSGGS